MTAIDIKHRRASSQLSDRGVMKWLMRWAAGGQPEHKSRYTYLTVAG